MAWGGFFFLALNSGFALVLKVFTNAKLCFQACGAYFPPHQVILSKV